MLFFMRPDYFRLRVESIIEGVNKDNGESLSMGCPLRYNRRFIPDYVIDRESKPFLIIEEKEKLTPFAKNIFANGVLEWDAYGILTDGENFIVYGKLSCAEIAKCKDLVSAIKKVLAMAGAEGVSQSNESNDICGFIATAANDHLDGEIRDRVINLVDSWGKSSASLFEVENSSYVLTDSAESALLDTLLGKCKAGDYLCRYCSLQSLFRMLKNGKYYLNNVLNMNDKTEGLYFEKRIHVNSECTNKIEYFIMSCSSSEKKDDFDMWRLYGEDTKGCCLIFRIANQCDSNFRIYPINYGNESGSHPEVEFLRDILKPQNSYKIVLKHLNEWGLFFKPFEYRNEKEVRVLYHSGQCQELPDEEYFVNERYGIATKCLAFAPRQFPLVLEQIIWGPNCPETEANEVLFEEMLKKQAMNVSFEKSKFQSYRI